MKIKNLVKAKELTEELGIDKKTLYRWNKEGKITAYRIPGKKIAYYDLTEGSDVKRKA